MPSSLPVYLCLHVYLNPIARLRHVPLFSLCFLRMQWQSLGSLNAHPSKYTWKCPIPRKFAHCTTAAAADAAADGKKSVGGKRGGAKKN